MMKDTLTLLREAGEWFELATEAADEIERLKELNKRRYAEWEDAHEQLAASQAREAKLRGLAQAVVNRWETPLWKDVEPTAKFIHALRDALVPPFDDSALREYRKKVLLETAMYLRETDWEECVWREIQRIAEEE